MRCNHRPARRKGSIDPVDWSFLLLTEEPSTLFGSLRKTTGTSPNRPNFRHFSHIESWDSTGVAENARLTVSAFAYKALPFDDRP